MSFVFMVGLVGVLSSSGFAAETLTVTDLGDSGAGTLREAIATANPGDTITFSPNIPSGSTITLTSGELFFIGKNLTIEGPGADKLAVSGNNASRVFVIDGRAYPSTVSISGLTIKEGQAGTGGGIINLAGALTLTNTIVSGNTSGGNGGGITTALGTLTLINSTVSANTASSAGGGIFAASSSTVDLTNSTVSGNTAGGEDGGGIVSEGSLVDLTNSTVSGNTAGEGVGGGIAASGSSSLVDLTNSTVSGNTSGYSGGGISVTAYGDAKPALGNTIVAGNIILRPQYAPASPDVYGDFTSQGHNLIGNAEGSTGFTNGQNGDLVGTTANPIDPMLGPLSNNGGPTQTHALLPGSPAIDRAAAVEGITTDQRGVARPQGAAPDIGAFELEVAADTTPPKVTSTIPTGTTPPVAPTINVKATFSEDMQSATVKKAFKLFKKGSTTQIAAVVSYDAATDTATLNPINNLRRGVTYKAVVTTGARDMAGNQLDQDATRDGPQQMKWFFTIRS